MSRTSDSSAGRRVQYAALPYRQRQDGEVQVRLITSRETRRWVLPKGWPMKDIAPHKAAAREAFEEAGLIGSTSRTAIGLYTYEKRLSPVRSVTCDVLVFPMKVKRYLKKWPERSQRIGFWFTVESAAAAVQEEELKDLILRFGAIMADRYAAKQAAKQAKALEAQALQGDVLQPVPGRGISGEGAEAKGAEAETAPAAKGKGRKPGEVKKAPVKKDPVKKAQGKASSAKAASGKAPSVKAPGKGGAGPALSLPGDDEEPDLGRVQKGKGSKRKGVLITLLDLETSETATMPEPLPTAH